MRDRDDLELLTQLQRGDEPAFAALIDRHDAALRRAARAFVSTPASADEVVQDTWLAVLGGLPAFEGRSSIKTWIFRILINRAKTRGTREARTVPIPGFDEVCDLDELDALAALDGAPCNADTPKHCLLRKELAAALEAAIRRLPERQRAVVVLRDALGWSAHEVCNMLDLHETNQRVLLHRARSRLRAILADAG